MTTRAILTVAIAVFAAGPVLAQDDIPIATITAAIETQPVEQDPDDPAIWVHPTDPGKSLVLGTDKDFGLVVFDLEGNIVQSFPDGRLNNVDLRQGVMLGGHEVTLVAATKREDNTIVFYTIDAEGRVAHADPFAFPGAPQPADDDIYGIGLYRDVNDPAGPLSVIVSFKSREVVHWTIEIEPGLNLTFARQWTIPSQPEGVVADDTLGYIYVGEEDGGIWRYDASSAASTEATLVDAVGSDCLPEDDVEGLAIYPTGPGTGYLVASVQGVNGYVLYDRAPDAGGRQPCLGAFTIGTGATDPVGETDGLEVTATPLGERFPKGMLVVQDDRNEGFSRNFKYVSWAEIEAAPVLPR